MPSTLPSEKFPVALFCFNRPEATKLVFESIREYQPPVLFVFQDGPREQFPEDLALISQVRDEIFVTWECQLFAVYREGNLGLLESFSQGLRYVFSNAESCIVLEDDCLAGNAFFDFMEFGLRHYRNDATVGMIHGYSDSEPSDAPLFAYRSRIPKVWGWASWSDRVLGFDAFSIPGEINCPMSNLPELHRLGFGFLESLNWSRNLRRAGKIGTWDYQWCYFVLSNFGSSIAPSQNLVRNIGIGSVSTHTRIAPPYIQFQYLEAVQCDLEETSFGKAHHLDRRERLRRLASLFTRAGMLSIVKKFKTVLSDLDR